MAIPELGKLEPVPVRDVWPDEARDFTPWLAENLDQLGAALEMNLELVAQEAPAGRFKLDILAKDADFGVMAAIENQLEWTDHNHLGQLLTYAGNHDVRRLIWVAPNFLPEHRAALEWLNQWTDDEIEVYGVEVTVARIGDSIPAPSFNKVVSPAVRVDRTKQPAAGSQDGRVQFYARFYRLLHSDLANEGIYPVSAAQGGWVARYRRYHTSVNGTSYSSIHDCGDGLVHIGFQVWKNKNGETVNENGETVIAMLRHQKDAITREMHGVEVYWSETVPGIADPGPGLWVSKPALYSDPEAKHIDTRAWMLQNLVNLRNAIQPRLEAVMSKLNGDAAAAPDHSPETPQ